MTDAEYVKKFRRAVLTMEEAASLCSAGLERFSIFIEYIEFIEKRSKVRYLRSEISAGKSNCLYLAYVELLYSLF